MAEVFLHLVEFPGVLQPIDTAHSICHAVGWSRAGAAVQTVSGDVQHDAEGLQRGC